MTPMSRLMWRWGLGVGAIVGAGATYVAPVYLIAAGAFCFIPGAAWAYNRERR